ALAVTMRGIECAPCGPDEKRESGRDVRELGERFLLADLVRAHAAAQRIVVREQPLDLLRQRGRVLQIDGADRTAANLVFVSRADAALGRAQRLHAIGTFARLVEFAV